jgi:hypothetical protein
MLIAVRSSDPPHTTNSRHHEQPGVPWGRCHARLGSLSSARPARSSTLPLTCLRHERMLADEIDPGRVCVRVHPIGEAEP